MEHRVPYFCRHKGEFTPTLKDEAWLTMLILLGEANSIGIILEEDYQTKLKYLSVGAARVIKKVYIRDLN